MEKRTSDEIKQVFGEDLTILPNGLSSSDDLTSQFKAMLGSAEAGLHRGVVYCYLSDKPVKTKNGETCILYLGKTKSSIKQRYFRYSDKLSSGKNAEFYQQVINNYGGVKMGFISSDSPREDEKACFSRYRKLHGQMPPKSKRG